jgi:hypothetical protein
MTTKNFLDQAAEYAYKELDRLGGDPTKLDVPLQTVAVIYTIQAIIDNGGFRYLFESDFPFCPPYSFFSEAYRRIGAADAADRIDRAVAMFPFDKPHQFAQERNKFMDSLEESHEIFELGNQVCGDEAIWLALERYVNKNAAAFRVM